MVLFYRPVRFRGQTLYERISAETKSSGRYVNLAAAGLWFPGSLQYNIAHVRAISFFVIFPGLQDYPLSPAGIWEKAPIVSGRTNRILLKGSGLPDR